MKTGTKVVLIIASIFMGIGLILMLIVFMGGGSFHDFNNRYRYSSNDIIYDFDESYVTDGMEIYDYSAEEVRSLDIDIAAARVTISEGEEFSVKIENTTNYGHIYSKLRSDGTLEIDQELYRNRWLWNSHEPRVFISIPSGSHFESIDIEIAAGFVYGRNLDISALETNFSVDAGAIELSGITSSMTDIEVDAGGIILSGTFSGQTEITCNVGSVDLQTTGDIDEWSYAGEATLGGISINNKVWAGITRQSSFEQKDNHFDIECNMGSVDIRVR